MGLPEARAKSVSGLKICSTFSLGITHQRYRYAHEDATIKTLLHPHIHLCMYSCQSSSLLRSFIGLEKYNFSSKYS